MSNYLKDAKAALNQYRKPTPEDPQDYAFEYAKISALVSIAESLEKLAIQSISSEGGKQE
jgi:hypothetical protein